MRAALVFVACATGLACGSDKAIGGDAGFPDAGVDVASDLAVDDRSGVDTSDEVGLVDVGPDVYEFELRYDEFPQFIPSVRDFGSVRVGGVASGTIVLGSTGVQPQTLTMILITSADREQFAIRDSTCRAVLPSQETCTITIVFAPLSPGQKNSSLAVYVPGMQPSFAALTGLATAE